MKIFANPNPADKQLSKYLIYPTPYKSIFSPPPPLRLKLTEIQVLRAPQLQSRSGRRGGGMYKCVGAVRNYNSFSIQLNNKKK